MTDTKKKMDVLCKVGQMFNSENITWAIGASLLLFFEQITDTFHDVDIMVHEKDIDKAKEILLSLGELHPPISNPQYASKHFLEFTVDDVEVDLMAGFAIIFEGKVYDCSLQAQQIAKTIMIQGVEIPLHSVSLWREYYRLMRRDNKVAMIDRHEAGLAEKI